MIWFIKETTHFWMRSIEFYTGLPSSYLKRPKVVSSTCDLTFPPSGCHLGKHSSYSCTFFESRLSGSIRITQISHTDGPVCVCRCGPPLRHHGIRDNVTSGHVKVTQVGSEEIEGSGHQVFPPLVTKNSPGHIKKTLCSAISRFKSRQQQGK